MLRSIARVVIALAVLAAAAFSGLVVASQLGPEQLRRVAEEQLARTLRAPVSIEKARIRLRRGLVLHGENVKTWLEPAHDAGSGMHPERSPGLYIERVEVGLDLFALLAGRFRISRLTLIDATLQVERHADGSFSPTPVAALLARRPKTLAGSREAGDSTTAEGAADEFVRPFRAMESAVRFLLEKPFVTRSWELRGCTIALRDQWVSEVNGEDAPPVEISLGHIRADLKHSRRGRGARLALRGRILSQAGDHGVVEWEGTRGTRGLVRTTVAMTGLELETFLPYVRATDPGAYLEGNLSGAIAYEATSDDDSQLELDFIVRDAKTSLIPEETSNFGLLETRRADARMVVDMTPELIRVKHANLSSGDLDVRLQGTIARPLHPGSTSHLAVSLHDVELARLLERLGWLPELEQGEQPEVEHVESGRLVTLTARGSAPISGWRDFMRGHTAQLPRGFTIDAEVAHARVRVGETDRLEGLTGHIHWTGDRVEITNAHAELNGSPLPILDVSVEGVSHLFATKRSERALRSGGVPLVGLRPFWEAFAGDDDDEPSAMATTVWLEIDSLEHPMFLWPIDELWATIEPTPGGIHITTTRGRWAGAIVHGDADWLFEPEERMTVRLTAETALSPAPQDLAGAEAPADDAPPAESSPPGGPAVRRVAEPWGKGRFTVASFEGARWRQKKATGSFTASGGVFDLNEVEIELDPTGRMSGSASVDLGQPAEAPYEIEMRVASGDLGVITELLGLPTDSATGQVDLTAHFKGSLRPRSAFVNGLEGQLTVAATSGDLRRGVPPVIAVALASDALNPFASRERVRFDRLDTIFDFTGGMLRTDSLLFDGPDLRIFASGKIDLVRAPHEIDAEVAVFLFRVIDRAIEKIPLLNTLLLGDDDSFQAAYYQLSGPWDEPDTKLIPMRSLASGPASLILERVPQFLRRGLEALGSALRGQPRPPPGLPATPPRRS